MCHGAGIGKALRIVLLAGLAAAAAAAIRPSAAGDWPQFRGPGRDGVSRETGLLDAWPEGGPAVVWRVPLGSAYSGLSVVGERIYTMESRDGREYLVALSAGDGARAWSVEVGPAWDDRWSRGPRSTPTVDGDLVFAVGSRGRLLAVAAADGAVRWSVDLAATHGAEIPQWGVSTSPLVHGGRVFVPVGGKNALAMAFSRDEGRELWRSGQGSPGYSSPLAVEAVGVEQILFFTSEGLVSTSPRSGEEYWRLPWDTSYEVNAAAPVFVAPDRVFVSSGYDKGGAMLRLVRGESGPAFEEIWRNREMKNRFSTAVYHDGHLYGFDENTFKCVDAATGETRWRQRDLGHGSLILADGRLIALGEKGDLVLVEASPRAYREIARARPFSGKSWTAPSLARGRLYLRDESEAVALVVGNEPVNRAPEDRPAPGASVP